LERPGPDNSRRPSPPYTHTRMYSAAYSNKDQSWRDRQSAATLLNEWGPHPWESPSRRVAGCIPGSCRSACSRCRHGSPRCRIHRPSQRPRSSRDSPCRRCANRHHLRWNNCTHAGDSGHSNGLRAVVPPKMMTVSTTTTRTVARRAGALTPDRPAASAVPWVLR
jgi:hypothetical protein